MSTPGGTSFDSYGQSFSSVRRRPESVDQCVSPQNGPAPYGRSFSSVRQPYEGERHPALPNNRPLPPSGVKPRRSSPRLESFDYIGLYAYSITINTDERRPYFRDSGLVGFCVRVLDERASKHGFEVLAYCFMPNHVHLPVIGLTEDSRLKLFLQQFKQITGYRFKQEHGAHLWHRSYHDHVARAEEDIHAVAAYIRANPVRAGLVERAEDYPYSRPAECLLGDAGRLGDKGALGGQRLSSVRTDRFTPSAQA